MGNGQWAMGMENGRMEEEALVQCAQARTYTLRGPADLRTVLYCTVLYCPVLSCTVQTYGTSSTVSTK
jgi:hypothetical protein